MLPRWWNWGPWPPDPSGRRSGSRNDPMPKSRGAPDADFAEFANGSGERGVIPEGDRHSILPPDGAPAMSRPSRGFLACLAALVVAGATASALVLVPKLRASLFGGAAEGPPAR